MDTIHRGPPVKGYGGHPCLFDLVCATCGWGKLPYQGLGALVPEPPFEHRVHPYQNFHQEIHLKLLCTRKFTFATLNVIMNLYVYRIILSCHEFTMHVHAFASKNDAVVHEYRRDM